MPRFTHDGCSFLYETRGSGPRALFLNGSGASIESSAPLIDALARTMEVVVHDQRGLGATDVPGGPYTMAGYARDAYALLAHLGWERCTVVGISFGGMVAQEFAVTWPVAVERLVLLCTSAGGEAGSSYPLHTLAGLPARERAERHLGLLDARFTPEWLAGHPSDAAIVAAAGERAAAPKSQDRLRGERLQLEARMGHDVAGRLGHITAPVYVLAGRHDNIAPLSNSLSIVERTPDAVLSVYEGGHMFTAQDPRAIGDVRRFVATGERTARE